VFNEPIISKFFLASYRNKTISKDDDSYLRGILLHWTYLHHVLQVLVLTLGFYKTFFFKIQLLVEFLHIFAGDIQISKEEFTQK